MRAPRLVIILAGALMFIIGIRILGRSFSTTRWPVVPARVISSRVLATEQGEFSPAVEYEYILAGRIFRGNGIRFPSESGALDSTALKLTSRHEADSIVAAYPPGAEVMVGFDPGNPGQSVLSPALRWWSLIPVIGGGVIVIVAVWQGRRKRNDPNPA